MTRILVFFQVFLVVLTALVIIATILWCAVALHFLLQHDENLGAYAPLGFLVFWPLAFFLYPKTDHIVIVYLLVALGVFYYWYSQPARNERNWREEYQRVSHAELKDQTLTVYDVRDFEYHGALHNFTPRYHTMTYDMQNLNGVDLVLAYANQQVLSAKMMLVFRFTGDSSLVLSVERRREDGEDQDLLHDLFNQYEVIYVLGTEEDLIGRRINILNEDVFLYPLTLTGEQASKLLQVALGKVNRLYTSPKFYNTFTRNQTTSVLNILHRTGPLDWITQPELLLNGLTDRYLLNLGLIKGEGTYWAWKYRHYVTPKVKNAGQSMPLSDALRSTE